MSDDEFEPEIQALWVKYEEIAMHFNDLLMRLRSQSLAGIAAVSTLVGIFTKTGADARMDWLAATALFVAMTFFWIAIFCLDWGYYNRLLVGAVTAIKDLESKSGTGLRSPIKINMSTVIEAEFASRPSESRFGGVLAFYGIVLAVIVCGAVFSYVMFCNSR
jgi:hypothetical protein